MIRSIFKPVVFIYLFILFGSCFSKKVQTSFEKDVREKNGISGQQLNEYYRKALVNQGNDSRIAAAMRKAIKGDSLVIGFIGGSITAGANASPESNRWVNIVADWWQHRFPKAGIKLVNAGIGATNSIYGVHRAERDLLQYNPDFVVVEFCVNDDHNVYAAESYEGLIRKILSSPKKPGILALSMLMSNGKNAQEDHLPVCKHYNITMISQRDALKEEIYDRSKDSSTWSKYSRDDVHPNNWGHAVAAMLLMHRLDGIYKKLKSYPPPSNVLPAPLTANSYERSAIITNKNYKPLQQDKNWESRYSGWYTNTAGSPLVFKIPAGGITVNFKRTNVPGNGGRCLVRVDDKVVDTLEAAFPGGWGEYIRAITILKDKAIREHTLSFEFVQGSGKEFWIENIMVSNYNMLPLK
ncbi:MAG: SGNH/GDSL hydrolase family protein [Niabella sp.]